MVEIFRGQMRRRWSEEDKRRLVADTFGPGATVHGVARRHGISPSQLFAWRKRYRVGAGIERVVPALPSVPGFAAVEIAPTTPTSVADAAPAPPGLIEIELAGGDRVRISGTPDPAVVAAALRALAGR
jgi:transposase